LTDLAIQRPASIFDMAEHGGGRTALQWAVLKEMHQNGDSWFVSREGVPVGLFGIYPLGDGIGEAWFNVAEGAAKSMLALVRAIRLTLPATDYREIVTICTTVEGARVAKAIGFQRSGACDIGEIWTWMH
jgi:hypothetical protein